MTLEEISKKGRDFLGTKYAIMGGAMSWVSERNLVSAISNAGGFGVIASGSMPPDILKNEIQETQKLTSKPFGVNLITMHPELDKLIDVCIETKVSHVVLAGGVPKKTSIEKLSGHNIKVMCFAPAVAIAKRLIKHGADAIIIEGMEAGGHIGPVSTSVLAQEILPEIKDLVPVFIAGGIGKGDLMASYLELGASGCQIGTLFVCSNESIAHENFKKAFIRSSSRDATVSIQIDENFPVIPVRAISNKATQDFVNKQKQVIKQFEAGEIDKIAAQLEIEHFWAGALRKAVIDGDIENGSLMAGQAVGLVKEVKPVKNIILDLVNQAEDFLSCRK